MRDWLRAWFEPPASAGDASQGRQARVLNAILIVVMAFMVVSLAASLASWLARPGHVPALISVVVALFTLVVIAAVRALALRGRVELASAILLLHFALMVSVFPFLFGAASELILSGYVLLTMMAAMLHSRRVLVLVLAVCVVQAGLLAALDQAGRLPPLYVGVAGNRWIIFFPVLATTGLFAFWAVEIIRSAAARAQAELAERRRAEAELRRQNELFQGFVDAVAAPVFVKDRQQRWVAVNQAACDLLGAPREALIGRSVSERLAPEEFARFDAQDSYVLETGITTEFENHLFCHGVPLIVSAKKSRFIDPATGEAFVVASLRDITALRRMENELRRAREELEQQVARRTADLRQANGRLRALLDATTDIALLMAPDGGFLAVNEAAARWLGMTVEQVEQSNSFDLLPPDLRESRRARIAEVLRSGRPLRFEDGSPAAWYDNTFYPILSPGGEVEALAIFSRDITVRRRTEEALRISEERYALAARGANDVMWDLDLDASSLYLSPRWQELFGRPCFYTHFAVEAFLELVHVDDRDNLSERFTKHLEGLEPHLEVELRVLHADGGYRWLLLRGLAVRDENGRPYRVAGSMTDITERKRIEARLLHDALHDSATGLPNRLLLNDRLEQAIKTMRRFDDRRFALLFMDLDRFKDVNDSLGHSFGDELLLAVAQRVRACLRDPDTLARLGGDEFVVLLHEVEDADGAEQVARRIQGELSRPFEVNGVQLLTSASIGIVLGDESYARAEEVLRDADIAMYRAKAKGRACHAVFDTSMRSQVLSRLQMESELRRAVDSGMLELHYQPLVSLESGACSGFEALVRWRHPERGMISPAEFIPLAEESLLIVTIDRWVLREACRQLKEWQERIPGARELKINVNLSGKDFAQPDLIEQVVGVLRETGISPGSLRLEITERLVMENIELATQTLRQLQALGVQIDIDDFGTGFSSLTYLFQLPVNTLKIDRSFVNQIGVDGRKTEIVQTIVHLSHNIGLAVVAEGVETGDQVERLRTIGCDEAQGYLFARPLPAAEAEQFLRKVPIHPPAGDNEQEEDA